MKNFKLVPILLVTIVLLTGCIASMMGVKDYGDMTPKEKAGFAMKLYNNAASEYVWMFNTRKKDDGSFSDNDIKLLQKYWKVLDGSHKAIMKYDTWVKAGTVPTPEMEDELVAIIRTLTTLLEDN